MALDGCYLHRENCVEVYTKATVLVLFCLLNRFDGGFQVLGVLLYLQAFISSSIEHSGLYASLCNQIGIVNTPKYFSYLQKVNLCEENPNEKK